MSAVLIQIAIYCGIPVGADCFQIADIILNESNGTRSEREVSKHK
jgi:hypothetical protein